MNPLLSFDIEISNIFTAEPGDDFEQFAPFDISVAASAIDGGEEIIWLSRDQGDQPLLSMIAG